MNNNTLIVFLEDGAKHVLSFSNELSESDALADFESMHPDSRGKVKKYFYVINDSVSLDVYQNHYELTDDAQLTMNIRNAFAEKCVAEVRKRRDFFLTNLDVPFFRAMEEDDDKLKKHVTKLKNFLRDLPNNLRFEEIEKDSDIARYNPFGNIFSIDLIQQGNGYTSPPNVEIDPPNGQDFGFPAKAVALIDGGKVVRIDVVDFGCGYDYAPKVVIDAPENGEQAIAANGLPQNVMLSHQDIIDNTKLRY